MSTSNESNVADRLSQAIADYEYEVGESVRIHAGRASNTFVVEYSDGEEYLVTVTKVK